MKEFNWGHGIFIFYVIFVAAVVSVLIASFSVDHSLVVDNYYQQDLAYQKTMDKKNNTDKESKLKIDLDQTNKQIHFDFNSENNLSGTIHFYRASNKFLDFRKKIQSSKMSIDVEALKKGKWTVKVDWKSDGLAYYLEKEIII